MTYCTHLFLPLVLLYSQLRSFQISEFLPSYLIWMYTRERVCICREEVLIVGRSVRDGKNEGALPR
jgi:hypothetical protein